MKNYFKSCIGSISPILAICICFLLPFYATASCKSDGHNITGEKGGAFAGQWIVQEENDVLATKNPSDRAYTQGLRISFAHSPGCEPGLANKMGEGFRESSIGQWVGIGDKSTTVMNTTIGLGQHMFTPNDISVSDLIEDDRPYGGYLYLSVLYDFTDGIEDPDTGELVHKYNILGKEFFGQNQRSLELQLGLIGDHSLARQAQTWVHRKIDSQKPMGWDNQLDDEVGIFAEYTHRYRIAHIDEDNNEEVDYDLVPYFGIAVGNVQDYLALGLTLRYGKNIRGFHSDPLSPVSMDIKPTIDKVCGLRIFIECYAYIGAEARYIAHNIFLDGSLFHDTHSVDSKSFVYDYVGGFRFVLSPWRKDTKRPREVTIDYSYIRRSNEFEPLPTNVPNANGQHDYGTLTVKWNSYFN